MRPPIHRPHVALFLLFALCIVSLSSCADDSISSQHMFNSVLFVSPTPEGAYIATSGLENLVIGSIDRAKNTLDVAFEHLGSVRIAQAIIAAQARNVRIRVVSDADSASQPGMALLISSLGLAESGGLVRLGNGALAYNPQPTATITRSGDMNRMTHNFVIVDERELINLSGGFMNNPDGSIIDSQQWALAIVSQDLPRDFGDEFDQMYAGVFASTLDLFNGPIKSNSNPRVTYPTDGGDFEVYFGPQERPLKRLIDEVYAARASIYILTESLTNQALAEALAYKHSTGFAVRILIDRQGSTAPGNYTEFLRLKLSEPRLVNHPRIPASEIMVIDNLHQNLTLIDVEPSPIDNAILTTRAIASSQPLIDAIPFITTPTGLLPQTADVFCDSNMWVINQYPHKIDDRMTSLIQYALNLFNSAEKL